MPEENLLKFMESVLTDAQNQRDVILHEIAEKKKNVLEQKEMDVLKDMYKTIQEEISEIKNKVSNQISKTGYDARLEILNRRDSISKEVFNKLNDKITEFLKSDKYKIYLSQKLLLALKDKNDGITVLVREQDLSDAKNIIGVLSNDIPVRNDDTIKYGGFIILSGSVKIDETIDSKLEEQYLKFYEISGLTIEN